LGIPTCLHVSVIKSGVMRRHTQLRK
jgi:hypothetical protein